jgi:PAS domain S-box-containing protein
MQTVSSVAEILGFLTLAASILIGIWKISNPTIHAIIRLPQIAQRVEILAAKVDMIYRMYGKAVYVCRPDGYNVYVSPELAVLFGSTPERMRGSGWAESIVPEDRHSAVDRWIRCIETHAPYSDSYTISVGGVRKKIKTEAFRHTNIEGDIVFYVGYVIIDE